MMVPVGSPLNVIASRAYFDTRAEVMADAPKITDYLCDECAEHYGQVKAFLTAAGLRFEEDP